MICYLNGEWIPQAHAKVSVMDRGFLFGDGVYEVIPCYNRTLLGGREHFERLQRSLDKIGLENPHSQAEWQEIIHRLILTKEDEDQSIYIQVTRGAPEKRDHNPSDVPATVFLMSTPLAKPNVERHRQGYSAITVEDIRWHHCDIKAITLLPNIMARQLSQAAGVDDAILIRPGNWVTEAAASNLFIVKDGVIKTPPLSEQILPGITRQFVLSIASDYQLPFEEVEISKDDLMNADEVWLSSSTREIIPITQIDGQAIGSGHAGSLWSQVFEYYQALKQ